jgi:NADH-quinone oxidoreductase subunit J
LLTSHISEKARLATRREGILAALTLGAGALLTIMLLMDHAFVKSPGEPVSTDVQNVGRHLVSYGDNGYALPFEVISILLLAALIGAIIVARRERVAEIADEKDEIIQK